MLLVDAGSSVSAAARECGIERSTLIRALARRKLKLAEANSEVEAQSPDQSGDI
jgi:transposase-like protein